MSLSTLTPMSLSMSVTSSRHLSRRSKQKVLPVGIRISRLSSTYQDVALILTFMLLGVLFCHRRFLHTADSAVTVGSLVAGTSRSGHLSHREQKALPVGI